MELLNIRKEIILNLKEDIPELVDKFNHFILKPLPSKKNSVSELIFNKKTENYPKEFIIKIFRTHNIENEYLTLKKLQKQKLPVPKILFYKAPFLLLEKFNGINLCDLINNNLMKVESLDNLDSEIKKKIIISIDKLANWLAQLHSNNIIGKNEDTIVLNKGDTRLRDFIYEQSDHSLYGTDFEDSYEGNHIDDIAWICCSLLDTKPGIFEVIDPKPKIELVNIFIKNYYNHNKNFHFNFKYFAERLIENLNIVMKRRNIKLSLDKSNFIDYISKEI